MKVLTTIILNLVFLITSSSIFSQETTPAFPTAEGYGMWASGGRGGKVVEVTNLEDYDRYGVAPEGSLRWALKQYPDDPLTVVFRVSGIIDLNGSDLRCNRSGLTLAGQTAPGDGICIKGGKVNLGGSTNVIIRYMRFRVGLLDSGDFIEGAGLGLENGGNFIIDHCTFGWSGEENMTVYDDTLLTIQWCIVHEGLYDVGHPKGVRSYGSQWGGQTSTYHHNLLANNVSRTPRVNGARSNDINVLMDYVNNVNYNWGKENSAYGGDFDAGGKSHRCNWINNYYKPGPARPGTSSSYFIQSSFNSLQDTTQIAVWYMNGNYMEGSANTAKNSDNTLGLDASYYTAKGVDKSRLISLSSFEVPYTLSIESAQDAYNSVLAGAGAFPRDTVDIRIIHEVETGTAIGYGSYQSGAILGIIDNPDIVGGFPVYETYNETADSDHDGIADYWEKANGMDTANAEDRNNLTSDGYTYLDVYLNGIVGEYIDGFNYPKPVYVDTNTTSTSINKYPAISPARVKAYLDRTGNILHIQSKIPVKSMLLYDLNGRIVGDFSGPGLTDIDLAGLPKGIYLSKFNMDNETTQTIKFVK